MQRTEEIRVPDIGDFRDVEVVEVHVKAGDVVAREQALIVVESDKATLEIPSPIDGVIASVALRVGDKVSQGTLIGMAATSASDATAGQAEDVDASRSDANQGVAVDHERYDLVVIGGGPGGYSAAFRAADLGLKTAIVERYDTLGGVCLNVGCIPSKALLHVAAVKEEAERIADKGIRFAAPQIDLPALRAFKDGTVKKLTDGLSQMATARRVTVIRGTATFVSATRLEIAGDAPSSRQIEFGQCIIATGSRAVELAMLPKDERVVTSTGALALRSIPGRMLVIGAGIIGLEMATVYSALGAKIDLVERLPEILAGVDADAVKIWRSRNAHRFERIDVACSVTTAAVTPDGVTVGITGASMQTRSYDLVLQSAGRVPNSRELGLDRIDVAVDDSGFIKVDEQMRTTARNIFAIGDVVGGPMLAHKAVHEGHVAAEVAAGKPAAFDARIVPNVAYTDPEIAWVGKSEHDVAASGGKVRSAKFPWAASGRAIASGASYGLTKLMFDAETGRIVGGVIVGPHAGELIGEICLAIEMGADAIDIGKTIHPHPTLGETIGMAAEVYEGICTDLPPIARKR
ncbi:dihydrolipoamide dehydrogenase [Rhodopseudomonas sp. AAP120]|uniref:dihydrolipoyl dehydrogenase n=1 Tax=Rhodopseudomonas sp. AAP120 TaxID=1523430 RepID=UPI0006B9160A|nr:dihydrolipoyl dehydrogenase [Rhodopseudomonas sp. AAP120]KPF94867.1 dihydrolipoamide dehydrogenase [Rhodopseudomonas sp. AAP120]